MRKECENGFKNNAKRFAFFAFHLTNGSIMRRFFQDFRIVTPRSVSFLHLSHSENPACGAGEKHSCSVACFREWSDVCADVWGNIDATLPLCLAQCLLQRSDCLDKWHLQMESHNSEKTRPLPRSGNIIIVRGYFSCSRIWVKNTPCLKTRRDILLLFLPCNSYTTDTVI